jgi:hypothetical protein
VSRFTDVTQDVKDMVRAVRAEHFPELRNAEILVLFDKKKRMSGGALVLGRIQKTNDLIKKLSDEVVDEGYDYIMYLDKKMWESSAEMDRERVIRHEFRHCFVDLDARGTPYKLIGHTIEDFYEEVELNDDDPRWRLRLGEITYAAYDMED